MFIPFFITGTIIYIQLSNSLLEMTKESSVRIAKDVSALVEATLMQEIKLVSSIAADPIVVDASKTGDYRVAQTKLAAIHGRIGKAFFNFFMADKNGSIRVDVLFKQQIGINISDRAYFIKAKKGETSVLGPMFPKGTATPEDTIIIAVAPIIESNEFSGIVATVFNTDFLVDILSRYKIGRTGYAYLIDKEGLVLVHPKAEFNLRLNLLDQAGTEEIKEFISSGKTGAASYTFEGAEKIAGLARMDLTGWIAVFAQDKDEVMAPVNNILYSIGISGLLFLIITIAIIIGFSGKISHPIHKFMEMMKHVTQHSSETIIQLGLNRKIVYINPAYEKITGLKSEDIIGTELHLNNLSNVPEKTIWDSLESGIPWSGRVERKVRQSDKITLDVMLVPLRNERGVIQGYTEIGRDVTSELMFEKRLLQAQKLESIGTLAGGIAHDFNNILSGIFGYTELLLMEKGNNPKAEGYIRRIISASERARDLVSRILTFSRKTQVEIRPLLPQPVIKEALKLLRSSIPATIDIQSNINCKSAIMAESTQIHQIVMNLFTNAVHAIGENTGTITVELDDFMVDEEFVKTHPDIQKGKYVRLRVSDTGCGMERETMDRMFEPFFTTKKQGEGTGLGLSVVHGIVSKLRGIITAYSEIGKGAVFNIMIPCIEKDDSELKQHEVQIKRGSERIAIIDDEVAIATTLQNILTNLGYKVTAFTDGIEAQEAILANPNDFDVVITDHSMPKITGLEIANHLNEAGVTIPIILTSGYFGAIMEDEARNAGISELLAKPVNSYQLTDAIHRILKKEQTA